MARRNANGDFTYSDEEPMERSDDEVELSDDGMASDDVLEGPLVGPNHVYEPEEDLFPGIPHGEYVIINDEVADNIGEPGDGDDGYEGDGDEGDGDESDGDESDADGVDMDEDDIGDGEVIDSPPRYHADPYLDPYDFPPALPVPHGLPPAAHEYQAPGWVTQLNTWSHQQRIRPPYGMGRHFHDISDGTSADRALPVMIGRIARHDTEIRATMEQTLAAGAQQHETEARIRQMDEEQGHHRDQIRSLQVENAILSGRILAMERENRDRAMNALRITDTSGATTASTSRQTHTRHE